MNYNMNIKDIGDKDIISLYLSNGRFEKGTAPYIKNGFLQIKNFQNHDRILNISLDHIMTFQVISDSEVRAEEAFFNNEWLESKDSKGLEALQCELSDLILAITTSHPSVYEEARYSFLKKLIKSIIFKEENMEIKAPSSFREKVMARETSSKEKAMRNSLIEDDIGIDNEPTKVEKPKINPFQVKSVKAKEIDRPKIKFSNGKTINTAKRAVKLAEAHTDRIGSERDLVKEHMERTDVDNYQMVTYERPSFLTNKISYNKPKLNYDMPGSNKHTK